MRLLVVFFGFDRLEIFGFKNLPAIEALHVVDSVPAGDYLGPVVVTGGGLHSSALMRSIVTAPNPMSSPFEVPGGTIRGDALSDPPPAPAARVRVLAPGRPGNPPGPRPIHPSFVCLPWAGRETGNRRHAWELPAIHR